MTKSKRIVKRKSQNTRKTKRKTKRKTRRIRKAKRKARKARKTKRKSKRCVRHNVKMIGGALPMPFGLVGKFTLMCNLTGDTLERVNERRRSFGLPNSPSLHITLWECFINISNPRHIMFTTKAFHDDLNKLYNTYFLDRYNEITLTSQKLDANGKIIGGNWDIFGRQNKVKDGRFWARIYTLASSSYVQRVSDFKSDLFTIMSKHMNNGKPFIRTQDTRGNNIFDSSDTETFNIFSNSNRVELYYVNDFYLNVINWKPHISVLSFDELKNNQLQLYNTISGLSNDDIVDRLKDAAGPKVQPISNIITHINNRTFMIGYNLGLSPKTRQQVNYSNEHGNF